jgi:hypothetical protein
MSMSRRRGAGRWKMWISWAFDKDWIAMTLPESRFAFFTEAPFLLATTRSVPKALYRILYRLRLCLERSFWGHETVRATIPTAYIASVASPAGCWPPKAYLRSTCPNANRHTPVDLARRDDPTEASEPAADPSSSGAPRMVIAK